MGSFPGLSSLTWTVLLLVDSHLSDDQIDQLKHVLYNNKDIFLTKDNPSLGHTDLVQHHLVLKLPVRISTYFFIEKVTLNS
jgi:hypothetical protein